MLNARCGKCGRLMYVMNPGGMGPAPVCFECRRKTWSKLAKAIEEANR